MKTSLKCLHMLALSGLSTAILVGCARREFRIRMQENESGPQRTFSDSAPSRGELRDLEEAYGGEPMRDESG
ncbi:MAG TPA: hypothetical protein DCX60_06115, partial [Phycisphaerales bacterium]|nr:hypothetical protein [Phycisphaerales bacterium]